MEENKGLYDQINECGEFKVADFNLDTLVDFCKRISTPPNADGRSMIMVCSKQMAIENYISAYKYTDPAAKEVDEYRVQLQDNLEEGLYRIDSGSIDNFIEYLGHA